MLYLYSDEYENLKGPFRCWIKDNIYIQKRQVLVVQIEPILNGFDFGLKFCRIEYLLLRSKYGDSLIRKLTHFPIDVIFFVPEDLENPLNNIKPWKEMYSIGWAKINNNYPY